MFRFLFSTLMEFDTCNPPHFSFPKNLFTVMEISQVSSICPAVASAVHCGNLWFGTATYAPSGRTLEGLERHELLLYIVFVNARWEPSHAARRRKKQKKGEKTLKVTSILFRSYRLYVCVLGSCMRVFNNHRPTWKRTANKLNQQLQAEEATSHLQSFYAMDHI